MRRAREDVRRRADALPVRRPSSRPGSSALKRSNWPVGAAVGVVVAGHDDGRLLAARQVPEARQRHAVGVHLRDQVGQQPLLLVGLRDRDLVQVDPVGLMSRPPRRRGRPSGSARRARPSRFCPAQAGIALARVDDRAREVVGERRGLRRRRRCAASRPGLRRRRARARVERRDASRPRRVQRSAVPWNCIVSPVMPAARLRPADSRCRGRRCREPRPSRPASAGVGTHRDQVAAARDPGARARRPARRSGRSARARRPGRRASVCVLSDPTSATANSFSPSARRISA